MTEQSYQQALRDFRRARQEAAMNQLLHRFTGQADQLLAYHDVTDKLEVTETVRRGLQEIPLDAIVGSVGATHTGNFDLSFMRCIPNMTIMAPADENECYHMLDYGFSLNSPVAVRYPRGKGPGKMIDKHNPIQLEAGKGELIFDNESNKQASKKPASRNKTVTLLNFGSLLNEALSAAEELAADYHIKVVNMRFIKPLDTTLALQLAQSSDLLITLEDNSISGGAGSAVNECLISQPSICPVINLGLPDEFPEHGTQQEIHHDYGLDCSGIMKTIRDNSVKR